MDKSVLVTYGSNRGATEEIARRIGQVLQQSGLQADVVPVDQVRDLNPYKAVIVGSAVYIGKWHKAAVEFMQANEKLLAGRPVWLFSSGPTGEGNPIELLEGWRLPTALQPVAERIRPRDMAVFGGFIDPDKLSFIEKRVLKAMKKPFGDYRDWQAITAWATSIAGALKAA